MSAIGWHVLTGPGDRRWDYWLAHCQDFVVNDETGQSVGVVEDIVTHATAGLVLAVAATPRRERYLITFADVTHIDPGERRLTALHRGSWTVDRPARVPLLKRLRSRRTGNTDNLQT